MFCSVAEEEEEAEEEAEEAAEFQAYYIRMGLQLGGLTALESSFWNGKNLRIENK